MLQMFLTAIIYLIIILFAIGMGVSLYYHIKQQKINILEKEKQIYSDLIFQEDTIKGLLELIDIQIDLEVTHAFLPYISTTKSFNPINIDKLCNEISTKVFNQINKEHLIKFNKWNKIYKYSFWMDYIIKKTTCIVIQGYINIKNKNK